MKRLTNIFQIVALVLTAFFVVCLFTSSFPPWASNDDNSGGGQAVNTTVVAAGTTAAGTTAAGTTAAGGTESTAAAGTTAAASNIDSEALYGDQCASCHGKTGGGGFGPSLKGIQNTYPDAADEEAVVADGQGSMPGFSGDLSPEEITAVVAYTRTLG